MYHNVSQCITMYHKYSKVGLGMFGIEAAYIYGWVHYKPTYEWGRRHVRHVVDIEQLEETQDWIREFGNWTVSFGKRLHSELENPYFSWVNPLFLWPCSIAFCMFTRPGSWKQSWNSEAKNNGGMPWHHKLRYGRALVLFGYDTIPSTWIHGVIELDDGKIYRKALYLMVKTMVSCRFSLKPIQWWGAQSGQRVPGLCHQFFRMAFYWLSRDREDKLRLQLLSRRRCTSKHIYI